MIFTLSTMYLNFEGSAFASNIQVIDATTQATPSCGAAPTSSKYAIKFVAGTSADISQLSIIYNGNISANTPSIKVYTDSSGLLGSEIGTLSYSAIQQTGSNFLITYSGNVAVTANSVYWLEQNQTSSSVSASHCYENTSVVSTNGWNLSPGNSSLWRWRMPGNPGFDYYHWSVDFYITATSPDTTAPTFTSSTSFSVAENISTSTSAATIKVSESATVTISSGADSSLFNIYFSDSVTALIKFKSSPNYEAPADVGANNVYEITLTATDLAANAGTQSITITVTDQVDTSTFNSMSLSGAATYRQVVTITANVSVASRVTFRVKNNIISGCKNKLTSGSSPNIIATCSWRPSTRGAVIITATASPTNAGISGATATPVNVVVSNRSGSR